MGRLPPKLVVRFACARQHVSDSRVGNSGDVAIDKEGDVVNCGVCEYDFQPDDARHCVPKLVRYNFAAPLIEEAAPVTFEPDAMVATR